MTSFDQSLTALRWQSQDWSDPAQPSTVPLTRTRTPSGVSPKGSLQIGDPGCPGGVSSPEADGGGCRNKDQATITIDSDFSQFWKPEVKGSAGLVSSQASLGLRWLTSVCPSFCACLCPNLIL